MFAAIPSPDPREASEGSSGLSPSSAGSVSEPASGSLFTCRGNIQTLDFWESHTDGGFKKKIVSCFFSFTCMSFFWRTAGVSRNSWSAGSPSGSGLSTLMANSSFATDEGKAVSRRCRLVLFLPMSEKRATHRRVRAGGCLQSEESDTLKARDSDCAANPGNRSGCLPRCPQPAEQVFEMLLQFRTKRERRTTDALTRGFRACRRTQEATLMADLTGWILTVECGTMFHLSAKGGGI